MFGKVSRLCHLSIELSARRSAFFQQIYVFEQALSIHADDNKSLHDTKGRAHKLFARLLIPRRFSVFTSVRFKCVNDGAVVEEDSDED